ncbi:TPA: EndoU domain-containing protein, partial [Aeromonas veronii]
GGLNNYQYAPNPIGWVDPLGLTNIPGQCPPGPKINHEHIFHGEINKRGKTVGFHHEPSAEGHARVVEVISPPNASGVYRGKVEVLDT